MKKKLMINEEEVEIDLEQSSSEEVLFSYEGKKYLFRKKYINDKFIDFDDHGQKLSCSYAKIEKQFFVDIDGDSYNIQEIRKSRSKKKSDANRMTSPMPGKVISVLVEEGDLVKKGDSLIVLEAMKMEHTIKANKDGVVEKVEFKKGDLVEGNIELISIG